MFCALRASGTMARIVGCSLLFATPTRRTRTRTSALACFCYIGFINTVSPYPLVKNSFRGMGLVGNLENPVENKSDYEKNWFYI